MIQFGYGSFAYRKFTLEETVTRIAKLGYQALEIQADRPHLFPEDFDNSRLKKLRKLISNNKLILSNLNAFTLSAVKDFHHPSWIEKDKSEREYRITHTLRCLEIASELECSHISTEPGGKIENFDKDTSMKLFAEGLEKLIPAAERLGVKILIEPEPDLLLETTDDYLDFKKRLDSSFVGLNFDIGHFYCVNEDPAAAIRKMAKHIEHIHIEDIKDRIHDHKIPGDGDMDFDSIFLALRDINYHGFVIVELYPYQDIPDEAGKRSLEFLRKFVND